MVFSGGWSNGGNAHPPGPPPPRERTNGAERRHYRGRRRPESNSEDDKGIKRHDSALVIKGARPLDGYVDIDRVIYSINEAERMERGPGAASSSGTARVILISGPAGVTSFPCRRICIAHSVFSACAKLLREC